ncbi:unnamed protein product [Oreochromis niloticus]|nr:unnamed protein product [Mustela putorius furo]
MDPAGSAREEDILRVQSLVRRITHASDSRTISVGLKAIRAIVEGNPFLRKLSCYEGFIDELSRAKEALQARELADRVCSRDSTPRRQQTEICARQPPQQQRTRHAATVSQQQTGLSVSQQRLLQREGFSTPLPRSPSPSPLSSDRHSPAAFLAAMWSEDEAETVTPRIITGFPRHLRFVIKEETPSTPSPPKSY